MAADTPYRPKMWWQVAFNADPNDSGAVPLWTDLTTLVRKLGQNRRGRMYELAQSLGAQSFVEWRDPNEYLNPANTLSPYYPNIQPLRQFLGQGMWPNPDYGAGLGAAVNLINLGRWKGNNEVAPDPSFESYANGAAMPGWLTAIGAIAGTITTTNPQQGTKSLTYAVAGTATRQGASWTADCVPGQQYTTSVYLRQSTGSTQRLLVGDQTLAYDNFGRSSSNGWGTADFGGAWSTANGSASDFSVGAGVGKQSIGTLNVRRFTFVGSTFVDVSEVVTLSCPVLVTGVAGSDYIGAGLVARYADIDNHYRVEVFFSTDGYIGALDIVKRVGGVSTSIGTISVPLGFLPYAAGQQYKLRFECINATLRARIWPVAGVEPTYWHVTASDTALSAPGAVGCHTAATSGVTNTLPVVISFDTLMCVGADSSTSTTTSGSYVRLTRTFTATQPEHTITACTSGTATAGTINLDAIQHEPGASASAFTTSGPVIFPIERSYIERWPRAWKSAGFEGIAITPTVDGFAALTSTFIFADYYYALVATRPLGVWSLKSGNTVSALPDSSGNEGVNLTTVVSPFGAGTAPSFGAGLAMAGDAGAAGVGFVPDQSVAIGQFSQQAATIIGAGRILNNTWGYSFPGFLGNYQNLGLTLSVWNASIACWFKATTKNPSNYTYLMSNLDQSSYRQILSMGLDASGLPWALTQGSGGNLTATGGATNYLDNKLHFMVATLEQVNGGNTTVEIYVDGVLVNSSNTTTAAMGGIYKRDADSVTIGGLADGLQMYAVANGTVEWASTWTRKLTGSEISTLYAAGATGNNNELTGARVTRHLAEGPYVGATRISAGLTTLQPPSWVGSTDLLSEIQENIAVAEGGTFWMAPDGAGVFEGRQDRWLRLTPVVVFGENVAGGEIPYSEDIEFDFDPTFVYANVQVTRSNGGTFFGGLSADVTTAIKKFFGRAYTESADYATDTQAQDKADYVFYSHRAPTQRVSAITVDPGSNPTLWTKLATLDIGQRVTVVRRAKAGNAGAGLTMSTDYFIETMIHGERDMDKGTWKIAFVLSPIGIGPGPSVQPWILEDATYGVLDSTTILGN